MFTVDLAYVVCTKGRPSQILTYMPLHECAPKKEEKNNLWAHGIPPTN